MSALESNGTKPNVPGSNGSSNESGRLPPGAVTSALRLEYGIPVEVRLEIGIRPCRRMRRTAPTSLRVTVSFHLSAQVDENSGGCVYGEFCDGAQMSAFFQDGIAQVAKASQSTLRKDTKASVGRLAAQEQRPKASIEPGKMEVLEGERDPEIPVDLEAVPVDLEHEWLDAQPEPHVTVATPKGMTGAQRRTIEIMRDQLGLSEKAFQDVLEMHFNRSGLDALNCREAASLVTRLSRQVRQKLDLERRAT
jgi:hypothetical protein